VTRASIRANIQIYMGDIGASFWDASAINESIQDAYTELAGTLQIIRKNAVVTFPANRNYLSPASLLADNTYLNTLAIFDIARNVFLSDNLVWPRDFQKFRPDWELALLTPECWCPVDTTQIVIFGRLPAAATYRLYYAATAPILASDATVLLLPDSAELALEEYIQCDLLEQAEEFTKAQGHYNRYLSELQQLQDLSNNLASGDFMAYIQGVNL